MREQARIYAGALGESAVRETDPDNPQLVPDIARPLLRRLTDPTPTSQAKLYSADGQVIADSRVREGVGGAINTQPLAARGGPRPVRGYGGARSTIGCSPFVPHGQEMADGADRARPPPGRTGSRT